MLRVFIQSCIQVITFPSTVYELSTLVNLRLETLPSVDLLDPKLRLILNDYVQINLHIFTILRIISMVSTSQDLRVETFITPHITFSHKP